MEVQHNPNAAPALFKKSNKYCELNFGTLSGHPLPEN
jgi:hypothetical protein